MFTPTLRCECAQPASDRLMRKWCIHKYLKYAKIELNAAVKDHLEPPLLKSSPLFTS